jgi:hypothetical protein
MRSAALAALAISIVTWSIQISFAEVATSCAASVWEWPEGAGEPSPEAAVTDATGFATDSEIEPGTTTEIADGILVVVVETPDGYVLESFVDCESAVVLAFGMPASGHAAGNYFNPDSGIAGLETWPGANPNITVHFTANMGNNARTAARRGFQTWEDDTATVGFSVGAEHGNTPVDFGNCSSYDNEVHWNEQIGGNPLARAGWCWNGSGDIYTFTLAYDGSYNWHTGTGDPGANEYDVESVAAHEWGHAMGFDGHLTDADCGSATRATMCSTTPIASTVWRTLESHDIHTTENAYD